MSHKQISFIKSGVRICGYLMLPLDIKLAAWVLVLSEVMGIYEEVGDNGK